MKKYFTVLVLLTLLGAQNSPAADNGWYMGLGLGQSSFDTDISGTVDVDEEDTALKIFAGYEFNQYLAIEGFYLDAGEASITGDAGDTISDGTVKADFKMTMKAKSFGLVGIAGYPVHQYFYPYVKIGFHRWDADASASVTGYGDYSESDDGTDIAFGGGFRSDFTNEISLRGEFERFDCNGDDIDILSVGIMYRF